MEYLVTASQMQAYDQYTIETIGIPALVLMERAALCACQLLVEKYGSVSNKKILIVSGVGNNGADGLAMARLLYEMGSAVTVWVVGNQDKASEQWKCQRHILKEIGVEVVKYAPQEQFDFCVDALLGVGLKRNVAGEFAKAVEKINEMNAKIISLDLPSGINTDTGEVMGIAVQANMTVTFAFRKIGLCLYPGVLYAGEVNVCDIGIKLPRGTLKPPKFFTLNEEPVLMMPYRDPAGNKGTFGKVLIVAGAVNMAGAACLCAKATYRCGAGMVKVLSPEQNREIIQTMLPECLYGTFDDLENSIAWADVIVIGPGLGKERSALGALEKVFSGEKKPLLIDADAVNLLSEHKELQDKLVKNTEDGRTVILTPHVGELLRLLQASLDNCETDIKHIKKHLSEFAYMLSKYYHCIVVAKDARTYVCKEEEKSFINLRGNDSMAVAGSGDVLAGMIASLLAQKMPAFEASYTGVLLHGRMGELASAQLGRQGVMAGDLIEALGPYFAKYFS